MNKTSLLPLKQGIFKNQYDNVGQVKGRRCNYWYLRHLTLTPSNAKNIRMHDPRNIVTHKITHTFFCRYKLLQEVQSRQLYADSE